MATELLTAEARGCQRHFQQELSLTYTRFVRQEGHFFSLQHQTLIEEKVDVKRPKK